MAQDSQKRVQLSTAPCPSCSEVGGLKKILWGLPRMDADLSGYIIGGCCISEDDPEIGCVKCDWAGKRNEI